ncbi:LOW QUALITY PROTEIN: arylamine N-acetyltransferase, pineal gland isozyme NAT-10 [Ciona intestinalis]
MPDLKQYLERIKYASVIKNDASTLTKLCKHYKEYIPFDNLDMFGGQKKILDFDKVFNDLVVKKRGGFCYEQNGLFKWALVECGFEVRMVQCQVYFNKEIGFGPRFDHLALLVTCGDGSKWLADVGFGGSSFTTPLKLETEIEQTQNNGVYKLQTLNENEYVLHKLKKKVLQLDGTTKSEITGKEWKTVFKFDNVPRKWEDFKEMFDYQQDNEDSFMISNTLCTRQSEFGYVVLWGWFAFEKSFVDPVTEKFKWKCTAKDQKELKEILKKHFQLEVDFDVKPVANYKAEI